MTNHTKLTIWTLIADFVIIIGAGHGTVPLILMEIFAFPYNYFNNFYLLPNSTYENSISASVIFSLIGQLVIMTSIFLKVDKIKFLFKTLGLIFMWVGVFYLTHTLFQNDGLAIFTFVTSIPFLILSIILFIRLLRQSPFKTTATLNTC